MNFITTVRRVVVVALYCTGAEAMVEDAVPPIIGKAYNMNNAELFIITIMVGTACNYHIYCVIYICANTIAFTAGHGQKNKKFVWVLPLKIINSSLFTPARRVYSRVYRY